MDDDFQTMWERRLLEIAEPYLDPAPSSFPGSGKAQWSDRSTLTVSVEPGEESPPRSGFFDCSVVAEYNYDRTEETDRVSRTWGQILNAFGDGVDGGSPLRDRLRESPGRTRIPVGLDAVTYGPLSTDGERSKQYQFRAVMGITAPI